LLYGGIEGGGTKFVCAVSDESGQIIARDRFSTEEPAPTLARVVAYFKDYENQHGEKLAALGIASFGPVDLHPASAHYGYITRTPKAGWSYADVLGPVKRAFPGIPVGFNTDVNAAALSEHRWGAGQAWETFGYLTIGTGIGGGVIANGQLVRGLIHPETGHILLPKHPDDPLERGVCPFHPNCLEGLASGPSLKARWGVAGETLAPEHPAWKVEAYYLAQALTALLCLLSPEGIILGGSVMHQQQLFPMVRQQVKELLNEYLVHPRLETLEDVIVPPGLGDDAGVMGALALAMAAREKTIPG
jgi:fructokinase